MMSSCDLPPYILHELLDNTEYINYPVKNVQRIKYTCFDISKSLIAFGATSGGIYIFNRVPCEFVQLIPNKDGPITKLAISTNEKHIGFANGRGIVTVTACDQSLSGGHSSVISKEHQGNEVTAMVWSGGNIFTGDDVGKISVLQLQSFIAMFHSSSQTIMNLDSRICQLDVKDCMLLVSTLTRCYICDTIQEQYRQIGQKLRDGEFGACFVISQEKCLENGSTEPIKEFSEARQYNIVHDEEKFAVGKGLENVLIYCARPSSRLWEASIEGTVRRTHQFKQVLAKKPMKIITYKLYNEEKFIIDDLPMDDEGQSVNFSKIYHVNGTIFSFKKDALYFLDIHDETNTVWYDAYRNIVDAKLFQDCLYLWLSNGSLVSLKFMKVERFLMKCYIEEKYELSAGLCALFSDYLLSSNNLPVQMHIIVGLKEKVKSDDLLEKIMSVLQKFESLKAMDATQTKLGIYVLDNTFTAQSSLDEDQNTQIEDSKFGTLPPETLQTLKDLRVSVSDKLSSSKKILKEKWEDFEGKMKHLNTEKQPAQDFVIPNRIIRDESTEDMLPIEYDKTDIIYKESSQKAIEIDNNSLEEDKVCKSLYQFFRLSLVGKETEESNLISIIESYTCDIKNIYHLMLLLEQYCVSVKATEEAKYVPNNIYLSYLSFSNQKDKLLESIINDEELYKYFVDSCIAVNMKTQKLGNLGCVCGFPLPYNQTNQVPAFSKLIDEFLEKQWSSRTRDQCYEICKKMPYLWRKILYLRRNEDLLNLLQILLQMLDEKLLNSFLPQFTLDTWDKAIQLYATLHANMCLNCYKKFDHMSVKETLSWDDIGALVIKSIGGIQALKVMEKHASLIYPGEISTKFYHTCLLVSMYEKIDVTIRNQLTDTIYSTYDFEDSRDQICHVLRKYLHGDANHTALPITVAAKTIHWGLKPLTVKSVEQSDNDEQENVIELVRNITLNEIINNLTKITAGSTECGLCGLPLENEVLIKDGGLWVFNCGHIFHGPCLDVNKVKLCPGCSLNIL